MSGERVNVYAPADLWRRFDAAAKANAQSRSGYLRQLMLAAVRRHERGDSR